MFLPSTVTLLPALLEAVLDLLGQQAVQLEFGQPDVAVLVPLDLRHGLLEFLLGEAQADALGQHRHAEGAAVGDPLEHRGLQDVHQAR